jgi:hypothetical protein
MFVGRLDAQVTSAVQGEPAFCAASSAAVGGGAAHRVDYESLVHCRSSGPAALAHAWLRASDVGDDAVRPLIQPSIQLRDGRIYQAINDIINGTGHPRSTRLAALQVLTSYYGADLDANTTWLTEARVGDPIPRSSNGAGTPGVVPLPPSRLNEIPAFVSLLAVQDPDAAFALAALRVAQSIAWADPDRVPVANTTVHLSRGCGTRVVLESTMRVVVPLRLQVLGTAYDHTFNFARWTGGEPNKISLALPNGTVLVSYGNGHELGRLTERDGPCKPGQIRNP